MRFTLHIAPGARHEFTASGAAELLFGILDTVALFAKPDASDMHCALCVEHTCGSLFSGRQLEVWRGALPCEPARLAEYLEEQADDVPEGARPCSRAEALWSRAVAIRLHEALKGR